METEAQEQSIWPTQTKLTRWKQFTKNPLESNNHMAALSLWVSLAGGEARGREQLGVLFTK